MGIDSGTHQGFDRDLRSANGANQVGNNIGGCHHIDATAGGCVRRTAAGRHQNQNRK